MKTISFFTIPALTTLLLSSVATFNNTLTQAAVNRPVDRSALPTNLLARRLRYRFYTRPSRYRVGGFSRGAACSGNEKIMAFVPPSREDEVSPAVADRYGTVDYTASAYPTLFVRVPALEGPAKAQLTVQDAAGEVQLYNTEFTLSGEPGIMGIQLPDSVSPLEVGETYLWQMLIQCDQASSDRNLYIGSWLQRISLNSLQSTDNFEPAPLIRELNVVSERDKPALYAELGIWQEAVAGLAQLRYQNPSDPTIQSDWRTLLQETQMSEFLNDPILGIEIFPHQSE